jgi:hypothetical protein
LWQQSFVLIKNFGTVRLVRGGDFSKRYFLSPDYQ